MKFQTMWTKKDWKRNSVSNSLHVEMVKNDTNEQDSYHLYKYNAFYKQNQMNSPTKKIRFCQMSDRESIIDQ